MNNILKRWSSFLVIFALFAQVSAPAALALDDTDDVNDVEVEAISVDVDDADDTDEESDIDISDVDSDDAVEVLDELLEEEGNDDNEIDEIIDELLDDVDTDQEAEELIEEIETDVEAAIVDLEEDAATNPFMRLKIAKKILQHKAFLLRLRTKLIMNHKKIVKVIKRHKDGRRLYEVRWGVFGRNGQHRCPGLDRDDIITALEAGETPKCDVVKADYVGMISVDKGSLEVKKRVLFEKNDKVTNTSGSSVEWTSHIAGHWDGLLIEYTPSDEEGEVKVTISIGDLNETFTGRESMGRKAIGNGHFVEIRPLAVALDGVTDRIQDKIVENRLKVQEKTDKIRDRIRRMQLVRTDAAGDVSSESDELEDLLEDIEEYNFDDVSGDEITAEIDVVLTGVADGANKDQIKNRIARLRAMFASIKAKAKGRKFNQKFIPFKDTDDNEWYTKYVAPMKEKGIVSGYKDQAGNEIGEYRPGNNVTVAETLKIGLETSSNGNSDGVPALRAALNHWAKAYVKRAEELGLDLITGDTDLNRPATRGEVIRMMLEAAGVDPDAVSGTSFSDVPASHKHAAYIALAKELGIVSGDDGANTFRPDAPINRAEVAKIANQILEVLLGQ